ncbi:hypothetical protein RCH18_002956 [Flavobacterium sp. PL11]|uniref:T9SS type A sorting domain-containing protein n=1 Tax=Flavobacterium sp. PL11 TaxID=3071717 RepID=UPI002E05AD4D|nr:hypothetical protein [Flavobacterium sp. PL11]
MIITFLKNFICFSILFFVSTLSYSQNKNIEIDNTFPYLVNNQTLGRHTIGGDTIFISSKRTNPLKFQFTNGDINKPLVIINKGGQVKIESPNSYSWGAITFENCKYIKISGAGHPNFKYGFELAADQCGLAFSELSSDCEAEFIKISHDGFYGIMAKKNYEANPPIPYPVFNNLIIHDCFIENVVEGMYLGETKSPGMEFKHVKIYNNIVRNTGRESIQIANMVEDVEIYNNTLLNAGLENTAWQGNLLQIGDNSVANVYNNIFEGAPAFGIIVMGKGDCIINNNYLASNEGIFLDNRIFSNSTSPLEIKHNFFRATAGNQVIKNYNEINYLNVEDNKYNTDITFYRNESGNSTNFSVSNNTLTTVPQIQFKDPLLNDYSLAYGSPVEYQNMGAPGGPEYFETQPKLITITPNMITDLVSGGSVRSPLFLFDEQNLNIKNGEHAISNSWKPHYNMNNAPYQVIIDLGQNYYISEINLHDMHDIYDFTVEYASSTDWITLFVEPCDKYNVWKKHETNISTQFLRLSMNQNVFANVNEIIIYGYPLTIESEQIIITPNMVTDQVNGGSVHSPLFLFDEQNLNIKAGEHAISNSWKPSYTMNNAPYYVIIDLEKYYHISEINLHDMNAKFNFTIEYGSPSNWSTLLTDPLDKFKVWNKHLTEISTRYLRLSTPVSPYGAVNEIIIYGYPLIVEPKNSKIIDTSKVVTDQVQGETIDSSLLVFDKQIGEQNGHFSKINLDDMEKTLDFTVNYDDLLNRSTLFDDSDNLSTTAAYISSNYLNPSINEINSYGHPIINSNNSSKSQTKIKSADAQTTGLENIIMEHIKLYPNPVDKRINLFFPPQMMGKNNIQIKDILGKTLYSKEVILTHENPSLELNQSELNRLTSGYYFLLCENESGVFQTLKFIKK